MEFRRLHPLLRLASRPLLSSSRRFSVYDDEMEQITRPDWHVVMNGKYNKVGKHPYAMKCPKLIVYICLLGPCVHH